MTRDLELLIGKAKNVQMSPEQQEEQRRSFAYGNTQIENPLITRATIDEMAEKMKGGTRD